MSGIQQSGQGITFIFYYTSGGQGKTGLSPTVNVYNPAGSKVVDAGSATEIGDGLYKYDYTNPSSAGVYLGVAKTNDSSVDQKELVSAWTVGMPWVQHMDADVSSRASASAADDLALGVDTINDKVDGLPGAVWEYEPRSLTIGGGGGDTAINQQLNVSADYPREALRLTAGDVAGGIRYVVRDDSGRPVPLADDTTVVFNLRKVGAAEAVEIPGAVADGAAGVVVSDGWPGVGADAVPAAGDYRLTVQVGGLTYPLGRTIPVHIEAAL